MNTLLQSSEELFIEVCNGNHNSFNELYSRYAPKILAYAKTVLRDVPLAMDVVQHVFTAVYSSRNTFDGRNFDAWIFAIARHECSRQKKLLARTEGIENVHEVAASADGLTELELLEIRTAVDRLPEDDRIIIRLRYFDDLAYEDIANALGITLSATKVRLFRARKKLANTLKPHFKE